jgi:hypothetical protein
MVRGNWQRRVELTASARQAYKLQKESRRNKQHQRQHEFQQHRSLISAEEMQESYRGLEQWLDENGNAIVRGMRPSITVDLWTDSIPTNRPEYAPPSNESFGDDTYYNNIRKYYNESINNSNDDHNSHSKGGGRNSINKKSKKGKSHPNTKSKSAASVLENNNTIEGGGGGSGSSGGRDRSSSISSQNGNNYEEPRNNKLCAREFFFGKEKCKGAQQFVVAGKKSGGGGGRKGRSSSVGAEDDTNNISNTIDGVGSGSGIVGCCWRHYHQLPKNKSRTVMPPALPTPMPPMTLAQVLNEKFRTPQLHNPRDCNDDDDGKIDDSKDSITTNIKPTVSLPVSVRDRTLKSSFEAASITEEDGTSASTTAYIDMLYHTRFFVDNATPSSVVNSDGDDDVEKGDASHSSNDDIDKSLPMSSTIHESLQRILKEYNIPSLTSVVYLTIQGVLIFDRYRGGLVVTEKGERFLLYGEAITVDSSLEESKKKKYYLSLNENDECIDESSIPIYERLTHTLLDEILAFSDDECVGILPRVCKSWYNEIGSPSLWSMLLDRHDWPMSVISIDENDAGRNGNDDDADGEDYLPSDDEVLHHCNQLRETFISHYSVLRDVRALSNASTHMARGDNVGMSSGNNNKLGLESAIHMYNSNPSGFSPYTLNMVKIWSKSEYNDGVSARALATYYDCTLRLFEVVRGNNDITKSDIKCRQVACLRAAPPFISKKKGSCALIGMDMDEDNVACLVGEIDRDMMMRMNSTKWLTVLPRDDVVCAGNEGLLDDFIQSFDLRGLVIDFILNGAEGDIFLEELRINLHDYLGIADGDTAAVDIFVRADLISCGRGNFLFVASIKLPRSFHSSEVEEVQVNEEVDSFLRRDRLFLFSIQERSIVNSLHLERVDRFEDVSISLFASRPFKHRSADYDVLRTNIFISGLSTAFSVVAVEIGRTGSTEIFNTALIEYEFQFDDRIEPTAALTSSYAMYFTGSPDGAVLHFHNLHHLPYRIGHNSEAHSIVVGETDCIVRDMFSFREHYIAIVITEKASDSIVVYHISTAQEVCRFLISRSFLTSHAFDCIGDTLAMNVSNVGFIITGEDARAVGQVSIPSTYMAQAMTSPSIKQPKGKKKRLASLASGRKKDGFARGMSLRG